MIGYHILLIWVNDLFKSVDECMKSRGCVRFLPSEWPINAVFIFRIVIKAVVLGVLSINLNDYLFPLVGFPK